MPNGGAPGGAQPLNGGARAPPGPPMNTPLVTMLDFREVPSPDLWGGLLRPRNS